MVIYLSKLTFDLNPKPKTLCTISGRMTLFENHLEGLALKVSVSVVLQWRVAVKPLSLRQSDIIDIISDFVPGHIL